MDEKHKVILNTDPDTATYRTDLKGWVSANGHYYGEDERLARWDGATDLICEKCGNQYLKHSYCGRCANESREKKWQERERKPWDGVSMLCSDMGCGTFYTSLEDAEDDLEEGQSLEQMRLVICEPEYLPEIDIEEYFQAMLPEDMGLEDIHGLSEVAEKAQELNEAIRRTQGKSPCCWRPGKYALMIPR